MHHTLTKRVLSMATKLPVEDDDIEYFGTRPAISRTF